MKKPLENFRFNFLVEQGPKTGVLPLFFVFFF